MSGNPSFLTPAPALATVTAAIADLQTAETAALARTKGAAATRNAKRAALVTLLQSLRMYVQSIADQSASVENAPAIIQSAGIGVKKTPARRPRVFAALAGANSGLPFHVGEVTETANLSRRAGPDRRGSSGCTCPLAPAASSPASLAKNRGDSPAAAPE
jgi:hypothetical protein